MKRLALLIALVVLVAGCATSSPMPPAERAVTVAAAPRAALVGSIDVLVERGFVIRLADADLGRVDAVLATRSGYVLTLETSGAASGTRVAIHGRQGGQPIDPARFDPLLAAIRTRLAEAGGATTP